MDNENKSSAELAREERKARIEKTAENQAAKKEKKENQSIKTKRLKVIIPVAVIVIALVVALLFFFGVPQRTVSAVNCKGGKASQAEFEFYERYYFNYLYQTAAQYEQYGEGIGLMYTGFDITKSPANQKYPTQDGEELPESVGKEPTWAKMIEYACIEQIEGYKAVNKAAKDAGYKLPDDLSKEIDKTIETLRETASQNNFGLSAYLKNMYGRGMNEKLFRKILIEQYTYSDFMEKKNDEYAKGVTDDEITKYYDENKNDINLIELRVMEFTSAAAVNTEDTSYTEEQLAEMTKAENQKTIAKAKEFITGLTADNFDSRASIIMKDDYESSKASYAAQGQDLTIDEFVSGSTTMSGANYSELKDNEYFGEEVAKWAYDSARHYGDVYPKVIEHNNDDGSITCIVTLISSLPQRDESFTPVAVRHILVGLNYQVTEKNDEGEDSAVAKTRTMDEAYAIAEKLLADWKAGEATEDKFAALASEKSDDTGSADNGGLYDDITADASYVQEFKDWALDSSRKVGDTGLVKTEYGVHIMYLSNIPDKPQWKSTVATSIATDKFEAFAEGIVADEVQTRDGVLKRISKNVEDYAAQMIRNAATQQAQSAAISAETSEDTSEAAAQ